MFGFNTLALLIGVLVAASNLLVKFPINRWITWGAFIYPFTYLVTEISNYFYGPIVAKRVVFIGFLIAIIFSLGLNNIRIAIGSVAAFLVSQLLDIVIFSRLRKYQWWLAPLCASLSATFVDSTIFFGISFFGTSANWITLAMGTSVTKGFIDLMLLFPFRLLISAWKSEKLQKLQIKVPAS